MPPGDDCSNFQCRGGGRIVFVVHFFRLQHERGARGTGGARSRTGAHITVDADDVVDLARKNVALSGCESASNSGDPLDPVPGHPASQPDPIALAISRVAKCALTRVYCLFLPIFPHLVLLDLGVDVAGRYVDTSPPPSHVNLLARSRSGSGGGGGYTV